MVTQNQEDVQAPPAPEAAPEPPPPVQENPILGEIDALNNASDAADAVPAESGTAEATTSGAAATTETQAAPAGNEVGPKPVETAPQQRQPSREEIDNLQRQASEYEQLRQKAQIQQEATRYQQQLESQGYLPEQAQQASQQYMQGQQRQQNLMKQADQYGQHLMGKMSAAEHFAQKYNLQMNDLASLRQAETPEVMEELAKRLSSDRSMRSELAQLRKAKVPPQQFDNSQGAPDVAPNDSSWLDRYNAGDRSANAQAAARRAAGRA
tara:strand:- start:43 stop:843 length:801 start_codon:yes stop_codon:yes gene_type:complete